jgi:hypothetical protein
MSPFQVTHQGAFKWNRSFLVIGLSLLVVVAAATYAAVFLNELSARAMPPAIGSEYAILASNPELMVARRSALSSDAARLAANPELSMAHRYSAGVEQSAESTFLSSNPEVMLARRYGLESNTAMLAANPELSIARRYAAAMETGAEAVILSANPELATARHYVPVASFDAGLAPMSTLCSNVVNSDLIALDRNYGTFAGVWTNCAG